MILFVFASFIMASSQVMATGTTNVSVVLPSHQPECSRFLDPNLASFIIEMDHWPQCAGGQPGNANEFLLQVCRNLQERSGVPPSFRVGGKPTSPLPRPALPMLKWGAQSLTDDLPADSEDRAHLDLSVTVANSTYPPPTPAVP